MGPLEGILHSLGNILIVCTGKNRPSIVFIIKTLSQPLFPMRTLFYEWSLNGLLVFVHTKKGQKPRAY